MLITNGNMMSCSSIINTEEPSIESATRCPKASTNKNGTNLRSDKQFCNVFHECICNDSQQCKFVRTNVCPTGLVFEPSSGKCQSIEKKACETSLLHWIDSYKEPSTFKAKEIPFESVEVSGVSNFVCPPGALNKRFADPHVCNLFHLCVSIDNRTYSQPFLCPFSSVFRVVDSNTMYCDAKTLEDCKGKAFYRSSDAQDIDTFIRTSSLIIETNSNVSYCLNDVRVEDTLFCNTFHVCRDGKDEHFMCEHELLFNPVSRLCDYPINVACHHKQVLKKSELTNLKSDQDKAVKNQLQSLIMYPSEKFQHAEQLNIYGYKISLKCPIGVKNYLYPDREFCNVFHHCHGFSGKVSICDKGQAFDSTANGLDDSGVCNFENLVDCTGKFILTENGKRVGHSVKANIGTSLFNIFKDKMGSKGFHAHNWNGVNETHEELISGVSFDCNGKQNGHYRDIKYCDVFHACISNERKKSYSCAHLGERTYFDDTLKRFDYNF